MRISVPVGAFEVSKAKFIVATLAAVLLTGCSDSIERFSSNYDNPSDSDPVYTASVPQYKKVAPRPISQKYAAANEEVIVQSPIKSAPIVKPIAPSYDYSKNYKAYQQPKLAYNNVPTAPTYNTPVYKQPSFAAPTEEAVTDETPVIAKKPIVYKQVATAAAPTSSSVTVGPGMTLYGIAKANHLSVQQLADANHLSTPYSVSQGQVLRIPGAHMAALPEAAAPVVKSKSVSLAQEEQSAVPAAKPIKSGGSYTVTTGDTLFSIGRKYGVSPFAVADLNGLPHNKALALGQSLKIPGGARANVAQASPAKADSENTNGVVSDSANDKIATADGPAKKPASLALPKDAAQEPMAQTASAADPAPALTLRWPLKGKIISAFGAKPNGLKNEGINIAVPEGTNIQAAEGGVVAYAGNELKGYGNLVLVRHVGGYVTAYAHASQLLVKRGDTVKRGDVIAKAGQTGAVQSPQLHFEVRKGATALDPNKFLVSSTASN